MVKRSIERVDYLHILQRRKWSLALTTLIIFLASVITALILPPVYKSTATILIEDKEVPKEFASTMDSYAEQRIQYINQRIMTTSRLLETIQRLNLYEKMRGKVPNKKIISRMRNDVTLKPLSIEFTNRKTGTIAFTLSYQGSNPNKVQEVANWLASIFMEENRKERVQNAVSTMAFMENETKKLKSELHQVEAQIAAFKQEHVNELPETLPANVQTLSTVERNIELTNQRLRSLREREGYLRGELIGINPQLVDEKELAIRKQLADLNVRLLEMSQRYTDKHPDINKVRAEIIELESALSATIPSRNNLPADNPTYIRLSTQLAGVESEIKSFRIELSKLEETGELYRRRIANSPKFEEPFNNLITARNNTQLKYNEMVRQLMDAKLSYGAEKAEIGERFTLLEPPELPIGPFKPNRRAIVLIGLILGVLNGCGLAALREFRDDSVWDAEKLERMTSFPVFANIPDFAIKSKTVQNRRKRLAMAVGLLTFAAAVVATLYYFNLNFNTLLSKW